MQCIQDYKMNRMLEFCTLSFCLVDVQVLLMTDIVVFLQEKDQRYVFASLVSQSDIKPAHKRSVRLLFM